MLSITFLGTSGSVPTKERGMPAIALRWQGKVFLWDAGEGTQRSMMKYGVPYGSLKAMFISHLHLDHFLGIYGLIETLHLTQVAPAGITIYSPQRFESLLFNKRNFVQLKALKPGIMLDGDDFTIEAYRNEHSTEAYGFIFQEKPKIKFNAEKAHRLGLKGEMFREIQEKGNVKAAGKIIKLKDVSWIRPGRRVVYSGDGRPSKATLKAAKNADLLIHEATFGEDKLDEAKSRMHTTAKEAAELAKKAKVKQLLLTHISSRYPDALELLKEAKAIFTNSQIASDGTIINI